MIIILSRRWSHTEPFTLKGSLENKTGLSITYLNCDGLTMQNLECLEFEFSQNQPNAKFLGIAEIDKEWQTEKRN